MTQTRLAKLAGFVLAFAGIIDVVLRTATLGWQDGLFNTAHDPAKTFFHVALFPIAVAIFIQRFPTSSVRELSKRNRALALILASVLAALAAIYIVPDPVRGFCERRPLPSDVRNEGLRKDMQSIRTEWHQTLKNADASANGTLYAERYDGFVAKARGEPCSFIEHASDRAYWAAFLSALAVIFVAVLLWLLCFHLACRHRLDRPMWEATIVVVSLLTPWIVLRLYSEWYINFGDLDLGNYQPLLIVIVISLLVVIAIIFLNPENRRLALTAAGISSLAGVVGVLFAFKPEWFGVLAEVFARQNPEGLVLIYTLTSLFVGLIVLYVSKAE